MFNGRWGREICPCLITCSVFTIWDMNVNKLVASRTNKLQRLFELASNQAGYFTAAQARGLGYSARSLVHHVAAGHFEPTRSASH